MEEKKREQWRLSGEKNFKLPIRKRRKQAVTLEGAKFTSCRKRENLKAFASKEKWKEEGEAIPLMKVGDTSSVCSIEGRKGTSPKKGDSIFAPVRASRSHLEKESEGPMPDVVSSRSCQKNVRSKRKKACATASIHWHRI